MRYCVHTIPRLHLRAARAEAAKGGLDKVHLIELAPLFLAGQTENQGKTSTSRITEPTHLAASKLLEWMTPQSREIFVRSRIWTCASVPIMTSYTTSSSTLSTSVLYCSSSTNSCLILS